AHVHENEVGPACLSLGHSFMAVGGTDDLVAFALQAPRKHVAIQFVVFDEQNLYHGSSPLVPTRTPLYSGDYSSAFAPPKNSRLNSLSSLLHGFKSGRLSDAASGPSEIQQTPR